MKAKRIDNHEAAGIAWINIKEAQLREARKLARRRRATKLIKLKKQRNNSNLSQLSTPLNRPFEKLFKDIK